MRLLAVGLLLCCTYAFAGRWEYFFPEAVTSYGCKVTVATVMDGRDANEPHDAYVAEAWAERSANLGRWEMMIDTFPKTVKGRHRALRSCALWMDEAEKRVVEAAPIRVKK